MIDMPEKIWAWNTANCDGDWTIAEGQGIPYVPEALAQAMVAAALERAEELASIHSDWSADEIEHYRREAQKDARAALDAMLAKAREDALQEAVPVAAALAAAISLLDRTRQQAPSDKMFEQMVADYERALNDFRALIDQTAEDT